MTCSHAAVITKWAKANKADSPPRGVTAIKGLRVNHIPKGFTYGQVRVGAHDGIREYGYQWSDNRDDIDRKRRSLWVRVVCWSDAHELAQLRRAPLQFGEFTGDERAAKIGGRQVLVRTGDGALGHGRYLGWVERKEVVITVMASQPLVPELGKIVKGIRLS